MNNDKITNKVIEWLQEDEDTNISDLNSETDTESEHSNHDTESEQSDGTKWLMYKPQTTKTARQNIITKLPGVKGAAKNSKTILDCWKIFFPDNIIIYIVECTNQQLNLIRSNYTRGERDCPPTNFEEILAFFGLLYLAGVKKAQHLNTDELWSTDGTAPEFFSATMSKRRFHTLVQAIRFDDRNSRLERKKTDNLAPIRYIFDQFLKSCIESYTISEYATIDEMLEAFRGRCKFRQYIANKPAKYGIKIYALVDARTFYTSNMEIYAGKQPPGPFQKDNSAACVVKRLIEPIDKSGRNITMDNYFTSVPLANELYANHRLTIVGTLRKNKREIPPEFTNIKSSPLQSTMFAYGQHTNNSLLCSYVPKKNKNVLMLSTMHRDDHIDPDSGDLKKPEVITFYNLTKGGVDVVDRLKSEYSVTRISNRWPFTIFCSLLNIGAINSQIIYKANTNDIFTRRQFLTDLCKILTKPHLLKRATIPSLGLSIRQKIQNITGFQAAPKENTPQGKPRCTYCPIRKNRFTQHQCSLCSKPICKEHTASTNLICLICNNPQDSDD
ncbi:unnamed protein product [Macrosiphum euphorbiae]|uniref:PiggyBac transposable element-derived protein domain-containing protein n=1 Tax=Macrosiphum euphorbiae TaxID=13131 RepID=A0AAV0XMF5_9HEMI|nr:unnamed protein product [Macrosiphum euphorbiae]